MDKPATEETIENNNNRNRAREQELSELIQRQLFDHVPCGVAVIDRDRKIVDHNHYFESIFGKCKYKYCYEVYRGNSSVCKDCVPIQVFKDGKTRVNEENGKDKYGCDAFFIVHSVPAVAPDGSIPYLIQMCNDVTEIRRRQEEHKTLFDCVPCVIAVINREMRIVRANELFREAFGEINGYRCYEKLRKKSEPCEDCPVVKTFERGGMYQKRYHCFHKDGKQAKYLVTSSPLSKNQPDVQYTVMMAIDITESEELAEDLAETAISREIIIEDSMDAIWGTDEWGTITLVNPAAEELLGYKAREIIGRTPPQGMFPVQFTEIIKTGIDNCILQETIMTDKEGNHIPVRFAGSAITRQGKLLGYSAFAQDLRDIKRLERENLEAEKLAAVGQTIAGVAHSVKNILSGLEGGMYVFKSGMEKKENERISKGWDMIERNIGHISELARYLLNFTRNREIRAREIDPSAIVKEVVELYQNKAWAEDIELRALSEKNVSPASMDPEGIHACLANLVTNALDACQESAKPLCRVTVSCREMANNLIIEVEDEGCGMDRESQKKIFDNLFTTKKDKGTGLGLFLTRKIVQEHGGRIEMASKPWEGSRFTLIFPRDRLPKPDYNSGSDSLIPDNPSAVTSIASEGLEKESAK